jgi:hypothetical protein
MILGVFPPTGPAQFGVQAALIHRCLRAFPSELMAAVFGEPGDWVWIRRMLRIGVLVGMVDDIVVDYYPSQLWGSASRPKGLLRRD